MAGARTRDDIAWPAPARDEAKPRAAPNIARTAGSPPRAKSRIRTFTRFCADYRKSKCCANMLGFEVVSSIPLRRNQLRHARGCTLDALRADMKFVGFSRFLSQVPSAAPPANSPRPRHARRGLCCTSPRREAHAERIGHGVDVSMRTTPTNPDRKWAAKHVMVENNLTSNDVISRREDKTIHCPYRKYTFPCAFHR